MLGHVLVEVSSWLALPRNTWAPKISRANRSTVEPYLTPWEPTVTQKAPPEL